jgi:SAM-dependent methyltransferase
MSAASSGVAPVNGSIGGTAARAPSVVELRRRRRTVEAERSQATKPPESGQSGTDGSVRFLEVERAHLHRAHLGHPLAHIIRRLNATIERLVGRLELEPGATVVDYGCADMAYRAMFGPSVTYLGADIPGNAEAQLEIAPDGTLPLADGSVDAVFSSQVLEHVGDPTRYLDECARVLRPGGRLLLTTHGIMVHHRDPVDYWRWTGEGLRHVVDRAGLQIVEFEGVMGLASTGLQLFQDATFPRLPRRLLRPYFAVMQGLVAAFDRQSDASRAENALVFALIAQKPTEGSPEL